MAVLASAPAAASGADGRPDAEARPAPFAGATHPARKTQQRSLDAFAAERRRDAAAALRATARDLERAVEEDALRRRGDPAAVEAWRARSLAEEERDTRAARIDLDAAERSLGRPLGPHTRRVLEENAIRLRAWQRGRAIERRAGALRSEVADPDAGAVRLPRPPPP